MIYQGSRYENVPLISVIDSLGNAHPSLIAGTPPKVIGNFDFYTVMYKDRLDSIAYKQYGDPKLWWVIADANPDYAFYPSEIPIGTHIRIPTLSNG